MGVLLNQKKQARPFLNGAPINAFINGLKIFQSWTKTQVNFLSQISPSNGFALGKYLFYAGDQWNYSDSLNVFDAFAKTTKTISVTLSGGSTPLALKGISKVRNLALFLDQDRNLRGVNLDTGAQSIIFTFTAAMIPNVTKISRLMETPDGAIWLYGHDNQSSPAVGRIIRLAPNGASAVSYTRSYGSLTPFNYQAYPDGNNGLIVAENYTISAGNFNTTVNRFTFNNTVIVMTALFTNSTLWGQNFSLSSSNLQTAIDANNSRLLELYADSYEANYLVKKIYSNGNLSSQNSAIPKPTNGAPITNALLPDNVYMLTAPYLTGTALDNPNAGFAFLKKSLTPDTAEFVIPYSSIPAWSGITFYGSQPFKGVFLNKNNGKSYLSAVITTAIYQAIVLTYTKPIEDIY